MGKSAVDLWLEELDANGTNNGTGLGPYTSVDDGGMYDKLLASNPYRNLTYKKSWWQRALESLGFRTGYDTWKEQAQVNSAEYDARIMELMQQNEYNDPAAQAARERAAGMNPDLLGTGDVAEAASQAPDPNGMQPNPSSDFSDFGETFMGVLGKTITLYKDFKGLSELDNLIEAGDLDNIKKMYDSIDSFIQNRFQEGDFTSYTGYQKKAAQVKSNLESELLGEYTASSAYRAGVSEKNWKRWTESAGERIDSLMGDKAAFEAFAGAGNARIGATQAFMNPNYLKNNEQYDAMIGITPIISAKYVEFLEAKSKYDAYQENLREGALKNQGISQDIEGQRLDSLWEQDAGAKAASAEMAKYDADWYQHRLNAITSEMKKECLSMLRSMAKHNHFANLMLLNWSLDDMVKMGVNANASAQVGLNLGLGANIANTVSTIFKP